MKLTLTLTHACPLRCTYCYAGPKVRRAMAPEVARAAIDLGLDRARLGVLQLCLMGGEALLEPELLAEILGYASSEARRRRKKVFFQLTTSGVGLEPSLAALLAREKVQVTLSLDGPATAHDPHRPLAAGRGSHSRALRALKFLRSAGLSPSVNAVVHPGNVRRLPETVSYLLGLGFCRLSFSPNYLASWSEGDLQAYRQGMEALGEAVVEQSRRGDPVAANPISTLLLRRTQWWRRKSSHCGFAESELAVAPNGKIYPCERLISAANDKTSSARASITLGHVLEGGLDRGRVRAAARAAGRLPVSCEGCSLKKVCSRSCGGTNLLTTGEAGRASPAFCALEKIAVTVADALLSRDREARSVRGLRVPSPAPVPGGSFLG